MIRKVLGTIRKYNLIENGDSLVVGVSGGPDSVCLLHVLYSLRNDLALRIYAVHINHMLRGIEADMDQEYVRKFCEDREIQFIARSVDIRALAHSKGISLEEAGREARYLVFQTAAESTGSNKVVVAHNRNDQAETVLMHIIRGTGLDGLKGMEYKRGNVIRPLLDITRTEIENYCSRNALNPRVDSSNLQNIYTRNKIRLDLIPYINKLFETDITQSLVRMSSLIRDDSTYIEECVKKVYDSSVIKHAPDQILIDILKLEGLHVSIIKRVIRNAVRALKGEIKGLERIHIEKAVTLMLSGRTGAELHFPNGIRMEKSYDVLKIKTDSHVMETPGFNQRITIPGTTSIPEKGISVEAVLIGQTEYQCELKSGSKEKNIQFFDYETLTEGINVRNREIGDIFKPLKSNGKKKLKEYFIDTKVPRELRDSIPLITMGNEVVWIIGYKISDKFKVTENTKCVLKLHYIPN